MNTHAQEKSRVLVAALAASLLLTAPLAAETKPREIVGEVREVTLYRGQAQVMREMTIDGPAGSAEIVVTGLPQQVMPQSLFAEGSAGLEVRAVRHRSRAVDRSPKEEVVALDVKIQALQDEMSEVAAIKQLAEKFDNYLNSLEGWVAPTAKAELTQGVLDAEALKNLTEFSFDKRGEIAEQRLETAKRERELRIQLEVLMSERNKIANAGRNIEQEAVVFLEKRKDGPETLRVNYLVGNCGWSPAYNLRGDLDNGRITVEYNAVIQQVSGEDWDGVDLVLSTASPALSATGPGLASFNVALGQGAQTIAFQGNVSHVQTENRSLGQVFQNSDQIRQQVKTLTIQQQGNLDSYANSINLSDNFSANWALNVGANDFQILEINNGNVVEALKDEAMSENGPSLSYQLEGKVSLASRRDQQMIRIMRSEMASRFYYVASPVLTTHVYREAEVANTSEKDLLGGPVSVYLDGRFVGRMEMPSVAQGQTFVAGFGADPQLRATRELVSREESFQGGNQALDFTYRLAIENFKKSNIPLRLQDRVPYAADGSDLRVTLGDMKIALSKESQYLRLERPKGILRWELDVPAEAFGEKSTVLEFSYKLEFDRNFALTNPTHQSEVMQEEFNKMQMRRNRK